MTSIIITGGKGFLGQHLVNELYNQDYEPIALNSKNYDLTSPIQTQAMFKDLKPDVVFHLAATVGGIGANRNHPGLFFRDNMLMGVNVIHQAHLSKVKKIIMVGTTCSYPKYAPMPFREHSLHDGYPEQTNAPYGIAKRALLTMLKAYQDEYNLRFVYLIPTNIYGPWDNFDDSTSHVIPALIKKCLSGKDTLQIWGTGKPTRDFVYVADVAKALVLAMETYDNPEPLNVGSGDEIAIHNILYKIVQKCDFRGTIDWNTSMPDGQPRRALNTRAIKQAFAWEPEISLNDGLQMTIDWYKENYA